MFRNTLKDDPGRLISERLGSRFNERSSKYSLHAKGEVRDAQAEDDLIKADFIMSVVLI